MSTTGSVTSVDYSNATIEQEVESLSIDQGDMSADQKIAAFVERYNISPLYKESMMRLSGHNIVVLADDSGSMRTKDFTEGWKFKRRWDVLKENIKLIMDLACCFDDDGVDLFFLNREGKSNITNVKDIDALFEESPRGLTPLVGRLKQLTEEYANNELPTVFLVVTDGKPEAQSDTSESMDGLLSFMSERKKSNGHKKNAISYLLYTKDKDIVKAYDRIDDKYPGTDVTQTYEDELEQVKAKNHRAKFNQGDWMLKSLLGSIDSRLDNLDE